MDSSEIRDLFTRFFAERGHRRVPSSSLIPPPEERTLLFTTAGMVQMKPYFMGLARPPGPRMSSIQKCFRTSDIEEVGDGWHCTFFEMLGNFSVGDYFKAEVIPWAWELLTTPPPQGLGLSKERIWPTVFTDDDEAFDLWREVGVPAERIRRYDEKNNYWFMGAVGPCGPNTEIFYDFGEKFGCQTDCHPNCENPLPDGSGACNRFIELWNLVFMTLFQAEDGSRRPLPQRNVDTGAGLERWPMAFMFEHGVDWQGNAKTWDHAPTIYDSDLFQPVLARVGELAGISYDEATDEQRRAMRVVAEHARAATFLIADGVTPSNEGRGYVLRRLIRRAERFAGLLSPHVHLEQVAARVIETMSQHHENLEQNRLLALSTIKEEEDRFSKALEGAVQRLNDWMIFREVHLLSRVSVWLEKYPPSEVPPGKKWLDYQADVVPELLRECLTYPDLGSEPFRRAVFESLRDGLNTFATDPLRALRTLSASEVFTLYETYGLPQEITAEIAAERGFSLEGDMSVLMDEQRSRSRAATRFEGDAERIQTFADLGLEPTEFLGYETTRAFATVQAIVIDGKEHVRLLTPDRAAGHHVEVVLDHTSFYAEGGGQVGDRGEIVWPDAQFIVEDTQAVGDGGVIAHLGRLEAGELSVGDPVETRVDEDLRADTMRNHTGTHILHAALRIVLGQHARQAGSLVTPDRLRFDFTHLEALTDDEVRQVEALANKAVRENIPVHVENLSYEEALEGGALAFFGDKYADTVRVVGVCDPEADRCFSKELCGGTHVHASGEVGAIVIIAETSIGAGLRRIEAVTGRAAAERIRLQEELVGRLGATLRAPPTELESRLTTLQEENERLRRQLQAAERRAAREAAQGVDATMIGDTALIVQRVEAGSADALREVGDGLKARYKSAIIFLASVIDGKPAFLAMATPDVASRCPAADIVRVAAREAGGGGGGRPELAQGGGNDPSKLEDALAAGRKLIEEKLGA